MGRNLEQKSGNFFSFFLCFLRNDHYLPGNKDIVVLEAIFGLGLNSSVCMLLKGIGNFTRYNLPHENVQSCVWYFEIILSLMTLWVP